MLFIHVGAPKTASTFLQTRIFPDMRLFYSRHISQELSEFLKGNIRDVKRITEYATSEGTVVLSNERFVGFPFDEFQDFDCNMQKLQNLFPRAQIIYVTREYESWRRSLYSEYIFRGGTRSLEKFSVQTRSQDLVSRLEQYFLTHVLTYECLKNTPEQFVQQLECITGAKFYGGCAQPKRAALSPISLTVLRALNRVLPARSLHDTPPQVATVFVAGAASFRCFRSQFPERNFLSYEPFEALNIVTQGIHK